MAPVVVHRSRKRPLHRFLRSEIIEVCGCLHRSRLMTPIPAKDRDSQFGNEPLGRPPQVAGRIGDESPPCFRRGPWRRTPKTPSDLMSKIRQPPSKPSPVASQQAAPSLNARAIQATVEVTLDDRIADQAIRLREIWQHADTPPARPAAKPPDRKLQIRRADPGHPTLVVAECDEHPSLPTVGAQFWATHACLLLLTEILLRRTLHRNDDLHRGHSSCRNHAHCL